VSSLSDDPPQIIQEPKERTAADLPAWQRAAVALEHLLLFRDIKLWDCLRWAGFWGFTSLFLLHGRGWRTLWWAYYRRSARFRWAAGDPNVIYISPRAYMRAMCTLAWTAFRHPLTTTVIDLSTGRCVPPS
jgi:hypothetical protein